VRVLCKLVSTKSHTFFRAISIEINDLGVKIANDRELQTRGGDVEYPPFKERRERSLFIFFFLEINYYYYFDRPLLLL